LTRETVNCQDLLTSVDYTDFRRSIHDAFLSFGGSIDLAVKDPPECAISIEGLTEDVRNAQASLKQLLTELRQRSQAICESLNFDEHVLALLQMEDIGVKDGNADLSVEFKQDNITIQGKRQEVEDFKQLMTKTLTRLCEMSFEFDRSLVKYFMECAAYVRRTLAENCFKCVLLRESDTKLAIKTLQSNRHMLNFQKFLREKYTAVSVDLTDSSLELIRNKHLNRFVVELRQKNQARSDLFRVYISTASVSIAGENKLAFELSGEVNEFLAMNSVYETVLSDFSTDDLEYLKVFAFTQELNCLIADLRNSLNVKVDVAQPFYINMERKSITLK
jgi:hypothetical protein